MSKVLTSILNLIKTPWGPLGYITFKRTYARRINENDPNSQTEEFSDAVERVIKACKTQLKIGFSDQEEEELRSIFLSLKGSVAGRFWWQLGTKTVAKLGLLSLQNCAATTVDSIRAFTWAMDALMLGSGVGFNIQREYVYQLPKVKKVKITRQDTNDADFIVPDTRAGWVKLLEETLKAHFETGKSFTYSTVLIRGKGALIKGFGGSASGPEELCQGIADINKVINERAGKKLRPIDALDIMNIIGSIVVAGNVRRSAEIALGDADDLQYLNSKRWDLGTIPNYRAMSNNSVVCNDITKLPEQFWEGYKGNGEPFGLINLNLSRKIGRLGETQYPDPDVAIFNPCQPSFAKLTKADGSEITMGDLKVGDILLNRNNKETEVLKKWSTGIKEVYSYGFIGGAFVGTENHKVLCKNVHTQQEQKLEVNYVYENNSNYVILTEKYGWQSLDNKSFLGKYEVFDITVSDDTHTYLTNGIYVSNCAEQSLAPYETCCLAEVFLPNIESKEELFKVCKYLYRINKHSMALPCHLEETQEVVHKHMRMGIGITGYLQASEEQRTWLSDTYLKLREFDKEYSEQHNWPASIKLTTVKPSGTLSLLAGTTSGVHPSYAQYYIRRIRIASNSPLANLCRKHGYYSEYQKKFDGTEDRNTVVVSFPCSVPEGTVLAKDLTAVQQLEYVKRMQTEWSDNAVSCTVYYKKEELDSIKEWLTLNYNNSVKSVSFLLHSEHGFIQAPMEEITKEEYEELMSKCSPIDSVNINESDVDMGEECVSGACPIK